MRARHYNPIVGQFLSRDPFRFGANGMNPGLAMGLNYHTEASLARQPQTTSYGYLADNPAHATDPSGEAAPASTPFGQTLEDGMLATFGFILAAAGVLCALFGVFSWSPSWIFGATLLFGAAGTLFSYIGHDAPGFIIGVVGIGLSVVGFLLTVFEAPAAAISTVAVLGFLLGIAGLIVAYRAFRLGNRVVITLMTKLATLSRVVRSNRSVS